MEKISIFCDGGSFGNPGPGASAFVVYQGSRPVYQFADKIGSTTNNVAEYTAVIFALDWLEKNHHTLFHKEFSFYLDSQLVVNQLNGFFRIKNARLRNLIIKVRILEQKIPGKIFYFHIPRGRNKLADSLVKKILAEKS